MNQTQPEEQVQSSNFLQGDISIGKVSLEQKMLFAKYCSVMLSSGLTIVESVRVAQEQASGKLKKVLKKILHTIESGKPLSSALERYPKIFSDLFVNMVKVGEQSGTLEENFEYINEQLKKEKDLKAKIKGALMYPVLVLVASVVLGFSFAYFILPELSGFFKGLNIELPLSTRILLWMSDVMDQYGLFVLIGCFAILFLGGWLLKQSFVHPITHWLWLRLPIVKVMVRNTNVINTTRTLGILLKSGLTIDNALVITTNTVSNFYYKKALLEISEHVKRGAHISEHLKKHEDVFPKIVSRLILVGEKTGKLEENSLYLSDFFEDELDEKTKSLTTSLEPIMLILIGIIVAVLAISIITPIYEITGSIAG